jgi:phenylalanyl-tRNA synthetase beta chain
MTWALVSESGLSQVGASPTNGGWLRLANPLSQDRAILRPTLLFGMLRAISKNLAQGAQGARLFELGTVFAARPQPGEALTLGVGIAGLWQRSWQGSCASDLFVLKGLIEQLVARMAARALTSSVSVVEWAEPGQGMQLFLDGRPLGHAGQVARRLCEAYDCAEPVWFAELAVDALLGQAPVTMRAAAPSAFPPVKRDLSFVVERGVEFVKLLELIQTVGAPLASHVELIDRYTDHPQVPKTHHSLTFSIEYRDPSRTLTAAEVDELHRKISGELVKQFAVQLR